MIWNAIPTENGTPADIVPGQPDSVTTRPRKARDGLHNPIDLWFDGDYLWVGEFKFADRVVGYRASIDPIVPDTPESLQVVSATGHQIELSWNDNSYNEQGYSLERKMGSDGTYEGIACLGANTTGYMDENPLSLLTTYYWKVAAGDIDGEETEGPVWCFETRDYPGEKYTLDISVDAGGHSINWDGRDSGGVTVSSGVYFYRLEVGDETLSRKMILIN